MVGFVVSVWWGRKPLPEAIFELGAILDFSRDRIESEIFVQGRFINE